MRPVVGKLWAFGRGGFWCCSSFEVGSPDRQGSELNKQDKGTSKVPLNSICCGRCRPWILYYCLSGVGKGSRVCHDCCDEVGFVIGYYTVIEMDNNCP